jgi:hypothetical protein
MGYQTCPKCKGNNSKNFEKCTCVRGGIADKGCVVCKGSGKAPPAMLGRPHRTTRFDRLTTDICRTNGES